MPKAPRVEPGGKPHEHRGHADKRVERGDELRHRRHGDPPGDEETRDTPKRHGDDDFDKVGQIVREERRHHRNGHADHAEAVAPTAGGG